jgi:hypothetical protein
VQDRRLVEPGQYGEVRAQLSVHLSVAGADYSSHAMIVVRPTR